MPEFSVEAMPEMFVSDATISKAVSAAVARSKLRKIGSRLYIRNLDEEPEKLVLRNWYHLITSYYPDALITDRTALENQPAPDGSVCLISNKQRDVELPGLTFRPRQGPGPLESDRPFIGGARLASPVRAYLENMRPSRARRGRVARTLSREEIEGRLDALLRRQGEEALNRLRDEARRIAPELVIGTLDKGFAFVRGLGEPSQRAVFMMSLVSEVHPFSECNGRTARIMMNAELVASGEERIIIPTAYRTDYLGALKALSHNSRTRPLIRMLDYAQLYTHSVDRRDLGRVRRMLEDTGAFAEGEDAWLRMPGENEEAGR